jgi:hypothetical protein
MDVTKLKAAFLNFANVPQNAKRKFWNNWVETTHAQR